MVNRGRDISSGEVSGGRGKWARRGGKGRLTGTEGGGSLEQKWEAHWNRRGRLTGTEGGGLLEQEGEARWNRRGRLAGTGGGRWNGEESSWRRGLLEQERAGG